MTVPTEPTPEQRQQAIAAATQPHPIPSNIVVGQVTGLGAGPFVAIQINDATGVRMLYLEPDPALEIADKIRQAARQSKSGLYIPGTDL